MWANLGPPVKRQLNSVSLADQWWPDPESPSNALGLCLKQADLAFL